MKKRVKIKVCLLGDPAVGKTSLVQKFVYNLFSDSYIRTMGTKVSRKAVFYTDPHDNTEYEITMMIWDIMGQTFLSMPLDKYFKTSQGALIVCDLTRKATFNNLSEWKSKLTKESPDIPIIYLANKNDLNEAFEISTDEFKDFSGKENNNFFFTSAKTGENVNEAFQKLGELVITKMTSKMEIPMEPKEPVIEHIEDLIAQTLKTPTVANGLGLTPSTEKQPIDIASINPGLGYIVQEEKPKQSFRIFKEIIAKGVRGLCITRMHPKRIEDEYQITDTPIYWLSADSHNKMKILAPTFLPQLNTIIIDFIKKYDDVIILLEGIEYLIDQNDFKTVLSLIHSLNDHIMGSNARLILPIDPLILKQHEFHMLTRDLKIL